MKSISATFAKAAILAALAVSASACSVINLSDLGIPNPFASDEDVPPPADPSTDASTYLGPAPMSAPAPSAGFQTGSVGGTGGFGASTGFSNVAVGSDPRPADPNAARAYDMIVARAQANCSVPVLVQGFARVNGGYNANATCPTGLPPMGASSGGIGISGL